MAGRLRRNTTPATGSLWREKRPEAITRDLDDRIRRLVRVQFAETNGLVSGVGWWQESVDGRWEDIGPSRSTQIGTRSFLRRFEELGDLDGTS